MSRGRRRSLATWLLAGSIASAGCTYGGEPAPEVPLPERYAAGGEAAGGGGQEPGTAETVRDAAAMEWWRAFQDPTLDALIEEALLNNPRCRSRSRA